MKTEIQLIDRSKKDVYSEKIDSIKIGIKLWYGSSEKTDSVKRWIQLENGLREKINPVKKNLEKIYGWRWIQLIDR